MSILDKLKAALPKRRPKEPSAHGGGATLWQFYLLMTVWAFSLAGSLWMLLVFIAGSVGRVDWSTSYEATESGVKTSLWSFIMDIHWSVALGLFFFCLAIAIYNAVWLELRRHIAPGVVKNALTGIGCCVALFMISGATVVQQRGTDARARDDVIAAQSAQAGQAGVQERLKQIKDDLASLTDKRTNNEYAATAATMDPDVYKATYMSPQALALSPPQRRDILTRAYGASVQAKALKAERASLTTQLTGAAVLTVREEARSVRATGFMAEATTVMEDVRKPVTAILGELLAMTVFSAALAAWASRRAALAAPMGAEYQIADHSAEAPLAVDPEGPRMGKMVDAETGEELTPVKGSKPHFRVKGKRKSGKQIYEAEMPGAPTLPDDVGFVTANDPRAVRDAANLADAEAENSVALGDGSTGDEIGLAAGASVADAVAYRDDDTDDRAVSDIGADLSPVLAPEQEAVDERDDDSDAAGPSEQPEEGVYIEAARERLADGEGGSFEPADSADDSPGAPDPVVAQIKAPEPVVLSDEEYDRLEQRGVIVDGEFVPQTDQDIIEQEDDAPRYPALAAPVRVKEEAA